MSASAAAEPAIPRPSAILPMALPQPYQIGLLQRALGADMARAQDRAIALRHGAAPRASPSVAIATDQVEREEALACDREYAIRDLLPTVPASTMADAGVHVCRALEVVADLEGNVLTKGQLDENYKSLRRLLASILPVVRAASEHPLEDAVDAWALDAPQREFQTLESGA